MLQSYYGNGKGKTTAAVGAAIRAAGSGMRVLFVQFLKNGNSSECVILKSLKSIDFLLSSENYALFESLDDERIDTRLDLYNKLLFEVLPQKASGYQMIILDEILDVCEFGYVDEKQFAQLLKELKQSAEVIVTGHKISGSIAEASDYISQIKEIKHPYSSKLAPRKGIEY